MNLDAVADICNVLLEKLTENSRGGLDSPLDKVIDRVVRREGIMMN